MTGHPIFDAVLAFYTLLGAGAARYLWRVGTKPWSWQQPVRVPGVSKTAHFVTVGGSDHIGLI